MTIFLCAAVGLPALVAGLVFQMPGEAVLGLCALGMGLFCFVADHEWKAWRRYQRIAHEPVQGQTRIGLAVYDRDKDAA